mgnify:CR=1 FL=1
MCYVDGRWGRTYFIGKDQYVGASLANYGEYNPDETEMILSLASGRCLDIGANFGVIGQALESVGHLVEYFEPQRDIVRFVLSKNVNGRIHNTAVGRLPGTTTMPYVSFGSRANYGGLGCGSGSVSVPVTTIDSFGYDDVGFMKIDVEGFEEEVLHGASETIARCNPIMYIEDDRIEKSASLRALIKNMGYSIEEHKPTLYREDNYFGLRSNVWAPYNFASHNLICRYVGS